MQARYANATQQQINEATQKATRRHTFSLKRFGSAFALGFMVTATVMVVVAKAVSK